VFQYDLRCVRIPAGGAPEGQAASHAGMKRLHFLWGFKLSRLCCHRFKHFGWWFGVIGYVGPCVPKDCMAVIFKGRQFVKSSQHRRCKALCVCVCVCVFVCVCVSLLALPTHTSMCAGTITTMSVFCLIYFVLAVSCGLLPLEGEGNSVVLNSGNQRSTDTGSHPRRFESSVVFINLVLLCSVCKPCAAVQCL
jgi:hypothetical protein